MHSDLFLSLQSYSMLPCSDKPTRVRRDSATLIDNIFVNNFSDLTISGNIITDLSDHFSQFCIMNPMNLNTKICKYKIRDFSYFNQTLFNNDLQQINWPLLIDQNKNDPNKLFSTFYNKLNSLVNKHAPIKILSKRKIKQFSKPWITKGIRKAIKIKNDLYHSNDGDRYRLYRNRIISLTRLSKKLYYHSFFNLNSFNMKKDMGGDS